ncbi:MAG TPA: hypothetical protein GX700_18350, partial [Paracoccus sp.]|nr:hypothetical protein [Paracoccus sp. (in: a-proteobacteria)]
MRSQPQDPHDPHDPKGLIRESFRIEGIGDAECRSILLDWALSLEPARDPQAALAHLHRRHAAAAPGHPMTLLLAEAISAPPATPRRRGGRA